MTRAVAVVTLAVALLTARLATAAGYDSDVLWSGRYAGMAGAAVATVEGAQSLFFNPAGLVLSRGIDLDLEFSPTFARSSAPIATSGPVSTRQSWLPVYSAIVGYRVTNRLAISAGIFVVGGANADYGTVDLSPLNAGASFHAPINTGFSLFEASFGAAYEPLDGLRLGLAWRLTFAAADINTALPLQSGGLAALSMTSLADSPVYGFRVGAQYAPRGGRWGVGINWRTPVSFNAEGALKVTPAEAGSSSTTPSTATVTFSSTLPSQINVGGFISPIRDRLRVALQYDFTNDSANYAAAFAPSSGAAPIPSWALRWHDQHTIRVGAELTLATFWAVRAGYAFSTQVTPDAFAQLTLPAPGPTHTVTVGVGRSFRDGRGRVDIAGQYTTSSGDGTNAYGVAGHFSDAVYVMHFGGSYAF